jgi:trehalose/maltose transport system permease protein
MTIATTEAASLETGRMRASQLTRQRIRAAWTFLLPMIIVLAMVAGWPLLRTVWLSFTDATLAAGVEPEFIGFNNYLYYGPNLRDYDAELGGFFIYEESTGAELVYKPEEDAFYDLDTGQPYAGEVDREANFRWQGVLADGVWWRSVWNTVVFSTASVFFELALGMIIALTLNAHLPGRGLVRAAVLIPWAIPTIVSAKMWGWMLNDQYGVINEMLLGLGMISERLAWTASPELALPAVIAVDVWKTTPFMALLILAALQLLPGEIYEAGKVDGIHPVRMFFKVTLPLIKPAVMVAIIFRALDALRIFDLIYVLTSNSIDTMSMSIYARQQLVDFQRVGFGSAASTCLFLIVAGFTVMYIVLGRVRFDPER